MNESTKEIFNKSLNEFHESFQIEKIEKLFFEFQNENIHTQTSIFSRIQDILKEIQDISTSILNKKLENIGFELENKVSKIQNSINNQGNSFSLLRYRSLEFKVAGISKIYGIISV